MKRSVRPRALVHRGFVEAAGVVVSESPSADGGRLRALSLWSPGATVYRLANAWLVRWATPRRLRAEEAPGDVLVTRASGAVGLLVSAPLDDAELAAVVDAGAKTGDLVRVRGGEVSVERAGASDVVDPSAWLDLGEVRRVEVRSLGAPIAALKIVTEVAPRAVLGEAVRGNTAAFARALAATMNGATGEGVGEGAAVGSAAVSRRAKMRERLLRALFAVTRWFTTRRARPVEKAADEVAAESTSTAMEPPKPGAFTRWMERLDAWLADALSRTRLADAFGARYAKYLEKMVEAFERGDVAEALRMAVPLGDGNPGDQKPSTSIWTVPTRREALQIRVGEKTSGPGFASSLYDRIRALYRSTAERLEAEGRIEEAAFVHAELLGDLPGAVSLLERHGRLVRAAELAEAAKLAPELVARLWVLAGDLLRAVLHARRTRSFQVAVTKLEATDPALAVALRREWALWAAASGDLALAVEIAWQNPALREMTAPWIDDAIALGGIGGARMLARKLAIRPEALPEVLATLGDQAHDTSFDGARVRSVFAETMLQSPANAAAMIAERSVARTLIGDGGRGVLPDARTLVMRLAQHVKDGAFLADLPSWPEAVRAPLSSVAKPRSHTADAADVGTRALFDGAALPDGRVVVAMGEAGVWILSRFGAVLARLDAPAHALVLSDHGDRCLALARRGKGFRVTHVDLARRTSRLWGEAQLDAFATTYDGDGWVVGSGRDLAVVDALAPRIEVLRPVVRIDEGAALAEIVRDRASMAVRSTGERPEVWAFDGAASWTLRARHDAILLPGLAVAAIDASGNRLFPTREQRWGVALHEVLKRPLLLELGNATGPSAFRHAAMSPAWIAVAAKSARGLNVTLFDRAHLQPRWVASFANATTASMRFTDDRLIVCDDVGRALGLDLRFGDLAFDLRV